MWYQLFMLHICCGLWFSSLFSESRCFPSVRYHTEKRGHQKKREEWSIPYRFGHCLGEIVEDALLLNRYLFTADTAKIVTAFTPFYLITRNIDEDLQSRFYDPAHHKNMNQFSDTCHKIAQYGVGIPMVGLSSFIFSSDEDLRQTALLFAIGLPFVHSGKNILKKIKSKSCLRPWNEHFSREKRSMGGWPSGHMANVIYGATLFGLRHGPKWAIPIGLFAAFVLVDFINCNRHYLSQMIAGAGLGVIYAFAANKVIEKKLSDTFSLGMLSDNEGRPALRVAWLF
jgi:membrane-associated phospholipid phosphatase